MKNFEIVQSSARRVASASCLECAAELDGHLIRIRFGDPDRVVVKVPFLTTSDALQYLDGATHALQITGRWDAE